MRTIRSVTVGIAAAALALTAAACSGGEDNNDQAVPTTEAATGDASGDGEDQATGTGEGADAGDTGDVSADGLTIDDLMDMSSAELEALLSDPAALQELIASVDPAELEAALAELGVDDLPDGGGDTGDTDSSGGGDDGDSGGGGNAGGDAGDVCSLGADEIAALVGPPADSAAEAQGGGGQMCTWTGEPGQFGSDHTLAVTVWPGAEFYADPTEYGEGPQPSAGLGDESWINTEAGHVMWVRGDTTVDVFVPLGGPSEAELLTVARAVDEDLG